MTKEMDSRKKREEEKRHKVPMDTEAEQVSEQPLGEEVELDKLAEDVQMLQAELDQLRTDADESRDRYLRALADFDNFRKRQREETARLVSCSREELILRLLPVIDNFRRALESAEAGHSYEALVEGVSLTLRQMSEMFAKEGVEPIEAVGQQFDPELHEAMMSVETDEYPDHSVIDEFETGYTLNGKVLRPARVRVAVAPES